MEYGLAFRPDIEAKLIPLFFFDVLDQEVFNIDDFLSNDQIKYRVWELDVEFGRISAPLLSVIDCVDQACDVKATAQLLFVLC